MSSGAYLASEDSSLFREALRKYSAGSCLEIGAGNCGSLEALSQGFREAAATDVFMPSSSDWAASGASFVLADAASCFRSCSFDLVAFNPPYVPTDAVEDRAVNGGKAGAEVALRFLRDALRVVKPGGRVVMLLSSDNPLEEFTSVCFAKGFEMKKVSERHLFYETLSVYEATSRDADVGRSPDGRDRSDVSSQLNGSAV